MGKELLAKINKLLSFKEHRKTYFKVVTAMMAVVVFCTTYALILPAMTLSKETYCGLEEHTHTEECLAVPTVVQTLVCQPEADYVLHSHDENCYYHGELICTLPEYSAHTHTEDCYAPVRELSCGQTEREEHYQTADCYITINEKICGKEEKTGHTHTEDCYVYTPALVCGLAEDENHTHTDSCYTQEQELLCSLNEEEGHTHTEDCYLKSTELICGKAEGEAHSHTDECYTVVDKLKCKELELIPHTHDESCYTGGELTCGLPQVIYHRHDESCMGEKLINTEDAAEEEIYSCNPEEGVDFVVHTHDEYCYNDAGELVCTLAERQLHTHDESCYDEDGNLTCTLPEIVLHTHSEDCLVDDVLSCGLPIVIEHQHDLDCVNVEAMAVKDEDETKYSCGLEEHTHSEECYQKPEALRFDFTVEEQGVSGYITVDWSEDLPEDLECTVTVLQGYEEDYDAMYKAAAQSIDVGDSELNDIKLYQIDWTSNGEKYTLPEGLNPQICLNVEKDDSLGDVEQITGVVITPKTEDEAEAASLDDEDTAEAAETSMVYASSAASYSAVAAAAVETDDEDTGDDRPERQSAYSTTTQTADESGIMTLSLSSNTVAVAKTVKFTSTGSVGYYTRVTSRDQLTGGGQFVFVFADGNLMMAGNTYNYKNYYISAKFNTPLKVATHEVSDSNDNKYFVFSDDNGNFVKYDTSYRSYHWTINATTPDTSSMSSGTFWCSSDYYPSSLQYDEFDGVADPPIYSVYNLASGNNTSNPLWLGYDATSAGQHGTGINIMWNSEYGAWHMGANTLQMDSYYNTYFAYYLLGDDAKNGVVGQHESGYNMDGYTDSRSESHKYQNNILIYKYAGTSINIFDDETAVGTKENVEIVKDINPNTYENDVSSITNTGLTGTDSDNRTELTSGVLQYASDPASSLIQEEYSFLSQNPSTMNADDLLELQNANDGRVVTDKSVIYRKDDYGAFDEDDYGQGDFSVTLSAIGQEWNVREELDSTVPVDIMFVIDLSSSMTTQYYGEERWVSSVKALNEIAAKLMERNPHNRMGLVAFSNTAYEILPMDHYTCEEITDDGHVNELPFLTYGFSSSGLPILQVNSNLKGTNTTVTNSDMSYHSTAEAGYGDYGLWAITFTQRGLEQAYKTMAKVGNDTTAVINVYDDDGNVTEKTVTRQPVVVLLSDGDPTLCTTDYMDPSNGAVWGDGYSDGIYGYYTVLSANYFKNKIGIHYGKVADMYTIALGLEPEANYWETYNSRISAGDTTANAQAYAWDRYEQAFYSIAVLDPTAEKISDITDDSAYVSFKQLLTSTDGSSYTYRLSNWSVKADAYDSPAGIGMVNSYISARDSMTPYADYDYADGAYYGEMTAEELEDTFTAILNQVQSSLTYNFMLEPDTYVTFTDEIGDGMTVKGDPVLRFAGANLDNAKRVKSDVKTTSDGRPYTEYCWTGTIKHLNNTTGKEIDVPLSGIKARVYQAYKSADGKVSYPNETVEFSIPERLLPVYYPNRAQEFYYEADPVRLIYMVGLSDDELKSIEANSDEIKNKVYYTSQYDANTYESSTTVTFTPAVTDPKTGEAISSATTGEIMVNPYYTAENLATASTTAAKTENTTATASYSFYETMASRANSSAKDVTQYLGNNGKLTLNRPQISNIMVNKNWATAGTETDSVTIRLYASGTMQKSGSTTTTNGVWCLGEKTLSASDKDSENWTALWSGMPEKEIIGDYTYTYNDFYIREVSANQKDEDLSSLYTISYKDGDDKDITVTTLSLTEPNDAYKKVHPVLDSGTTVSAALANSGELTVVNAMNYTMPYTGSSGAAPYYIAGVMFIMLGAALTLFCKAKRREE